MDRAYIHTDEVHNLLAPSIVVPLVMQLANPKSVLDVGCGLGTWLKIFADNQVKDLLGIDDDRVDRSRLQIAPESFLPIDLRRQWRLNRRFDLVVCLEVAEHLPESSSDVLVQALANHGDNILFSAAIPGQGGQGHVNEQWADYWQGKFLKHGYFFHDVIRPLIWNDNRVDWWYRQNMFLLSKQPSTDKMMRVMHPECHNYYVDLLRKENELIRSGGLGVRDSAKIFLRSIRSFITKP